MTLHYITGGASLAWICIILSCSSPPNLPSQLPPQETHLCCLANYVRRYTLAQMCTTNQRLLGVPSSLLQHCQTHERISSSVRGGSGQTERMRGPANFSRSFAEYMAGWLRADISYDKGDRMLEVATNIRFNPEHFPRCPCARWSKNW